MKVCICVFLCVSSDKFSHVSFFVKAELYRSLDPMFALRSREEEEEEGKRRE